MKKSDEKYVLHARFSRFGLELVCLVFAIGSIDLAIGFLDPNYVPQGKAAIFSLLPHWLNVVFFGLLTTGLLLLFAASVGTKISGRKTFEMDRRGVRQFNLFEENYMAWKSVKSIQARPPFTFKAYLRRPWTWMLSVDVRDLPATVGASSHYELVFTNDEGRDKRLHVSAHTTGIPNEELRQLLHRYRPDLIPAPKVEPELQLNKPSEPLVVSAQSWTG